ncbi:ADRA2 protein, partial [Sterrhoptilus dennistouni]|nr:ADRA2 protein [Sterrhoptilus dennistouni]
MEPASALPNASGNGSGAGGAPHSPAATGLILLAALAVLLATLVGNALVVVAISTSRALQAPQNLFLISLASADILVAVLVLPFSLANEVMGYWYFGGLWCSLYLALDVLLCTASIGHLCLGTPGWRRRSQHQSVLLCRRRLVRARERRFTVVLAVVMGAFVLCWFPFFFTYSLGALCGQGCHISKPLFNFFFWIGYCNSSVNPLIYTLFNRDFRAAFRRLLAVPHRPRT